MRRMLVHSLKSSCYIRSANVLCHRKITSKTGLQEFTVQIVDLHGNCELKSTSIKELKSTVPFHARDILSLGVTVDQRRASRIRRVQRSPNLLLPRSASIVASFCNIKVIILSNKLLVFDPHLPNVRSWISHIVSALPHEGQAFELFVLEDLLKEICDSLDRRIAIYSSLLRDVLKEVNADESNDMIFKLAPLHDLLYEFELEVKEMQTAIIDVLDHDEDMAQLLLTRREAAMGQNKAFNMSDHEEVELLLENYALRLSHSINGILYLQQKVKSQQGIADLTMQMRRNRLLWLNVSLAASAVCISLCSAVTSGFGMNLMSGLENSTSAFYIVMSASLGAAATVYYRIFKYMRGDLSRNSEEKQMRERQRLENVFLNIQDVDIAVYHTFQQGSGMADDGSLSRPEFAKLFKEIRGAKQIDEKEVNMIFDLMDTNADGEIYRKEFIVEDETPRVTGR